MKKSEELPEAAIVQREKQLRKWFTRECDEIRATIDGLDIGWGGVQRWATARMPPPSGGPHLDFACGYGTFLAQLGWRFPSAQLIGLNIDYRGPHSQIGELLAQAGVQATLIQADARHMPFADGAFASVSCFLGLQDVEIGFGKAGVRDAVAEAVRTLRQGGVLALLDAFPLERFKKLLGGLPATVVYLGERELDVRWDREVAERAITLYAEGWVAQSRPTDATAGARLYDEVYLRMAAEMERQFNERDYYVPFGPVCVVVARKDGGNTIEKTSPESAKEILRVINTSNREAYRDIIPTPHFREPVLSLDELLVDLQRMTFYAYKSQGRIIGVAALHVEGEATGRIRWVYVLPRHQRKGIGTALISHLEAKGRKMGLKRLRLLTVAKAEWAVSFYTRLGYTLCDRIERPWGFDIFMEKELQTPQDAET